AGGDWDRQRSGGHAGGGVSAGCGETYPHPCAVCAGAGGRGGGGGAECAVRSRDQRAGIRDQGKERGRLSAGLLCVGGGLEGCGDGEAEGLAGFAEDVVGAVELDGLLIAVGGGAGSVLEREERFEGGAVVVARAIRKRGGLGDFLVEAQRVV